MKTISPPKSGASNYQHVNNIHLTPQIRDALLRANAAGRPVEMSMRANNVVLLTVDGQQFSFSSAPELSCDLVHLSFSQVHLQRLGAGEQQQHISCSIQAPFRSRIQPQRVLDDSTCNRLRASQEEKEDNKNKRKAVMLDGHVGLSNKAPVASSRTFQRPAAVSISQPSSKPPAPRPASQPQKQQQLSQQASSSSRPSLQSATARAASPLPHAAATRVSSPCPAATAASNAAANPAATKSALSIPPHAAATRASSPYPVRIGSPHPTSNAPSHPARPLKPPPPNSLKARTGLSEQKVQHQQQQQPSSRQGTPGPQNEVGPTGPSTAVPAAASHFEIPDVALYAAQRGKLQLVVVALLRKGAGISSVGLSKLIDRVYRDAKVAPDSREYIKRVVDNSTHRVPPNRLVIKQDILERQLPNLQTLEQQQQLLSNSSGSKGNSKKKRQSSSREDVEGSDGDGAPAPKKQKKGQASGGSKAKQGAAEASVASKAKSGGGSKQQGPKAEKGVGPVRPSLRSISDWDEDARDVHGYDANNEAYEAYEAARTQHHQQKQQQPKQVYVPRPPVRRYGMGKQIHLYPQEAPADAEGEGGSRGGDELGDQDLGEDVGPDASIAEGSQVTEEGENEEVEGEKGSEGGAWMESLDDGAHADEEEGSEALSQDDEEQDEGEEEEDEEELGWGPPPPKAHPPQPPMPPQPPRPPQPPLPSQPPAPRPSVTHMPAPRLAPSEPMCSLSQSHLAAPPPPPTIRCSSSGHELGALGKTKPTTHRRSMSLNDLSSKPSDLQPLENRASVGPHLHPHTHSGGELPQDLYPQSSVPSFGPALVPAAAAAAAAAAPPVESDPAAGAANAGVGVGVDVIEVGCGPFGKATDGAGSANAGSKPREGGGRGKGKGKGLLLASNCAAASPLEPQGNTSQGPEPHKQATRAVHSQEGGRGGQGEVAEGGAGVDQEPNLGVAGRIALGAPAPAAALATGTPTTAPLTTAGAATVSAAPQTPPAGEGLAAWAGPLQKRARPENSESSLADGSQRQTMQWLSLRQVKGQGRPQQQQQGASQKESEGGGGRGEQDTTVSDNLACSPSGSSAMDGASEGNADDELWNEVEPEVDPPHEAAVYAEFLDWCPPSSRPSIKSPEEHASVEAEYRRKHDIYFLIHQKYNAVMTELQSLRTEADKAARRGLPAEFSKWRRALWAQGARKYCQLRTWQRVIGVLHRDLLSLREVARAYVLSLSS